MSDTDFTTSDPLTGFDPPEGNAHQAEYSYDNKYIVTAEEDFAAFRVTEVTVQGVGNRPANTVPGGAPPEALDDDVMNGPAAYVGYACNNSADVPTPAEVGMPAKGPGEEWIAIVQRGPAFDPDEDYDGDGDTDNDSDDACFPGEKAANADAAGWDAVLFVNRHTPDGAAGDGANCGSGGYPAGAVIVSVCTTHAAFHEMYDDAPDYTTPYDDSDGEPGDSPLPADVADIGTIAPHKVSAEGSFDGWGYMGLYSTTPDEDGKLPLLDAFAIEEALNPDYGIGFGDLSIHEQAADPTEPLSYSAYYAGGVRVFSFEAGKITEQGAFIDEGGNNFWGIEQFTTGDGQRLMAASDRDGGLYILRYTGPLAAQRPVCTDTTVMVPFKGSVTVPLPCSDANAQNVLTRSIASQPGQGNVSAVNQGNGTVTYTHTGSTLGQDTFTFTANDGAANSAPATVRIQVVPANGPACGNPFAGTAAAERIIGSPFGDRIDAGGGNDNVDANQGDDCVLGGSGNDELLGGQNNDDVRGGSGRDRVFGESGRDRLSGGGGNDHLRGSSGNDRVDGGGGRDRVDGGSNNDRVNGGGGNDNVYAGPGRDRLFGGGGRDRLDGGAGVDRFSGGGGNDRILADDGRRERIRCGSGTDRVRADDDDIVAADCETVTRVVMRVGGGGAPAPPAARVFQRYAESWWGVSFSCALCCWPFRPRRSPIPSRVTWMATASATWPTTA
jgi:Ca2+-binding RTX toxin-like protein